ncbi:endoribonuclease YbeY [Arenicella chitinivorans]|uniref:Endoribonuclease YbeY n=2 Tax=Arenicella chitinivorans TaxID=1329800 RepID=A0A918VPG7_9GAMM|nr:endoribonuclease YbeY [Arenicella chitinivorans]
MIDHAVSDLQVDVQVALTEIDEDSEPPSAAQLTRWAQRAYSAVSDQPAEVTIRLCESEESHSLNKAYRGFDKPTNVLSFPFEGMQDLPPELAAELSIPILGDIVICHPVLINEAKNQQKSLSDHYAHMVTHGILHLCGYDHQDDHGADEMETLETRILAQSHIANPY